jgi:hypothetical protein
LFGVFIGHAAINFEINGAVADDRNNSPDRYDTVASEEAMVRAGLPPAPRGWYSGGYS